MEKYKTARIRKSSNVNRHNQYKQLSNRMPKHTHKDPIMYL